MIFFTHTLTLHCSTYGLRSVGQPLIVLPPSHVGRRLGTHRLTLHLVSPTTTKRLPAAEHLHVQRFDCGKNQKSRLL